jgi:hypothetical protein
MSKNIIDIEMPLLVIVTTVGTFHLYTGSGIPEGHSENAKIEMVFE